MQEQDLGTLEIRQYLGLLQRWLWLIVLAALAAGASAYLTSRLATPVYEASATLYINEGQKITGLDYNAVLMSERVAKTYAQILTSRPVLEGTAARLGVALAPGDVSAEIVRDTQLIALKARSTDPAMAVRIANTVPEVFVALNEGIEAQRFASAKESLSRELEATQAQVQAAEQALQDEQGKTAPDQAALLRLQSDLAQYNATYASLLRSLEEIRVAEATGRNTMTVTGPAAVPEAPVLPRTRTNTLLAAVVGAMLAVGAAFLLEYLDDTVKSPDDVQSAARLPTLATVSRFPSERDEDEPIEALRPQSAVAESYRVLRTNLAFAAMGLGHSAVTLVVTSSQPQEGKTTTLANLGACLAQTGKRVILVDTDLRRPSLHEQFGLRNDQGLTTLLLARGTNPDRLLRPTRIPRLSALTCGPVPANPAEVLELPQTAAALEQLKPLADYVLLDSPPVLGVADAAILAQRADGVLLVVEMGATRTAAFRRAVETLQSVKGKVVGVVLNKVTARPGGYYYYYDYNHYYRGGDDGKAHTRRRSLLGQLFHRRHGRRPDRVKPEIPIESARQ